jgi:hypothetical protein
VKSCRTRVVDVTRLEDVNFWLHSRVGIADEAPLYHNEGTTTYSTPLSYLGLFKSCANKNPQALDHPLEP